MEIDKTYRIDCDNNFEIELERYRKMIDKLDKELVECLINRFIVTDQVGNLKKKYHQGISNTNRERDLIQKNKQNAMDYINQADESCKMKYQVLMHELNITELSSSDTEYSKLLKNDLDHLLDEIFSIILKLSVQRQEFINKQESINK